MCLAQGHNTSDAGEARTRGPSVTRQALYNLSTVLPQLLYHFNCFSASSDLCRLLRTIANSLDPDQDLYAYINALFICVASPVIKISAQTVRQSGSFLDRVFFFFFFFFKVKFIF